jgi:indole-3-glycerol phosphate synthase
VSRLEEILQAKRAEIERLQPRAAELRKKAQGRKTFRDFRAALQREDEKVALIAEVKKASPSAGIISETFDPVEIAQKYERGGADAVSVLTDEKFFHGRLAFLNDIRSAIDLPLLRKDFILDEVQIAESVAAGADAILLIVAALAQEQLVRLYQATTEYQLSVLVEVHTRDELERALDAGAEIIGINNRDLTTFEVNLSVTEELSDSVPDEIILVSESGIKSAKDVARIGACGVDAILVGEALMRGEISLTDLRQL